MYGLALTVVILLERNALYRYLAEKRQKHYKDAHADGNQSLGIKAIHPDTV